MRTGVHYLTLKIRRPMATARRERCYLSLSLPPSLSLFLPSNPRIRRFSISRERHHVGMHTNRRIGRNSPKHSIRYDITRDILGRNFPFSSSFLSFPCPTLSLSHSFSLLLLLLLLLSFSLFSFCVSFFISFFLSFFLDS